MKTENAKLEADLPTLREIAGGEWKKETELKGLKSEVAALERKIQLALMPSQPSNKDDTEQQQSNNEEKTPVIIVPPKPPSIETYKGFNL